MKKTMAVLLAIFLLMAMSAGCSGGSPQNSATPEPTAAATINADGGDNTGDSTGVVPSDNYERYIQAKGAAMDRISDTFDENPELAMTSASMLFLVGGADMFFVPIYFVGVDEQAYAALETMYGLEGLDIQRNGQIYTITYTDEEGVTLTMTCEYDAAADSMQSTIDDGAGANLIFEYVRTPEGYASQYYIFENDEHMLIKTYFNDTDTVACGFIEADQAPASIFKNGNLDENFVVNDEMYVILINDELTVFENGEQTTY